MDKQKTEQITFRVQRYNPENGSKPYIQEFIVPSSRGMTVLDGLIYIKESLDSTIAFRASCRMAICGSCGMLINNYPHLACHTQIEEFHSDRLTIKPLPNFPIIKDLVVDLTPLFETHKAIKPYILRNDLKEMENPVSEYAQSHQELESFLQFTYCIKCGICVSACPTSASDKLFHGPQALAQCYRYCADNRDDGELERFPVVGTDHGVWHCHLAGACSESCPKGVDPALAIQLLKRHLVSRTLGLGKKKPLASTVSPPAQSKSKLPFPEFTVKQD
ncbi:MAG: succinate dehydrogenase iron-sulfur subunit [Dehalococcoidia bacterium]|nr:succinate dehydrogenase iron-sulfur subunit [Dehalococcoidia bacterium]